MTIKEILDATARLEDEAEKFLGETNEEFRLQEKRTPEWFRASDKMVFWTDVRNGLRQAENALLALNLMEGDQA